MYLVSFRHWRLSVCVDPGDIRHKSDQATDAGPLNQVELGDGGLGFDEVDEQAPGEICGHEDAKSCTFAMPAFVEAIQEKREQKEEDDLIELRWMAANAIAKVDAPGQCGCCSVSIVGQPSEEAADAAYSDTDAEWNGEEFARAGADAADSFDEFHSEPATKQSSDDGLAARKKEELPVKSKARGLFEDSEDAAAEESADGSGGDDDPALILIDYVSALSATATVKLIPGRIGQGFKERVERGMLREVQARTECSLHLSSSVGCLLRQLPERVLETSRW